MYTRDGLCMDGCATFYRRDVFKEIEKYEVRKLLLVLARKRGKSEENLRMIIIYILICFCSLSLRAL